MKTCASENTRTAMNDAFVVHGRPVDFPPPPAKMSMPRHGLLAIAMAIVAMLIVAESRAQSSSPESGFALEEVVVTARKIEENIQDAPLSVTAVTAAMLDERGAEQISAVADIAPNVNFSFGGTSSGSGSAAVVYIRGVGQNDFTPVTDPGVGIYVDDVYLGRTIGSVLDILDLERIEVLRGPQGTLFGRNTIGGAISLHTKNPGEALGGRLRLILGDDSRRELHVSASGPLTETFGFVLSGLYRKRDGTVERPLAGDELGNDDVFGGRLKLVGQFGDRLDVALSVDGVREREFSAAEALTDTIEGAPFSNFFNNNQFGNGTSDKAGCRGGGALSNTACRNDQWVGAPFTSYETGPNRSNIDVWGVTLAIDYALSENLTLESTSAYRKLDADFARASDGAPFAIFSTEDAYKQDQFSQEVRLLGDNLDDRLAWVAGAFYFEEKGSDLAYITALPPVFPRDNGGRTDNHNWALYGEATYDLGERLHLTAGLRYTDETKGYTPSLYRIPQDEYTLPNVRQADLNISELTWRGSLSWDATEAMTTYFTLSKGFKSGGFELRQANRPPGCKQVRPPYNLPLEPDCLVPTYQPEFVVMYEAGLKLETQTLRLGLAGFVSDYSDVQVSQNLPGVINTSTNNAAKAEILGVEAEFRWVPSASWLIEGAVGYQDAKYKSIGPGVPLDLDDELIRTPKLSANLGMSYLLSLGTAGELRPRLDWVHKSSTQFEPDNDPLVADDGYDALNLSAAYRPLKSGWSLTFGVNNVTDARYIIAGDSNGALGYRLAVYARPRNWYVNLGYEF